jgi:hypothetical protein
VFFIEGAFVLFIEVEGAFVLFSTEGALKLLGSCGNERTKRTNEANEAKTAVRSATEKRGKRSEDESRNNGFLCFVCSP